MRSFYGGIEALHGISLHVNSGEIVAMIGANGAGKSTTLMTICGEPRARSGRVLFGGADITHEPTFQIIRKGLSHAPEGRRIFPRMTVLENLQMGAVVSAPAHFRDDLKLVLNLFPILGERQLQRGGTLSGGEQQMLAIARALMSRPRLLLLDEPGEGIAPVFARRMIEILQDLKREGQAVLVAESNDVHIAHLLDETFVIERGRIVE